MGRLQLYIVVEGQTEQAFVQQKLRPLLWEGMQVEAILAETSKNSKGGVPKYARFKKQIENLFAQHNRADACFSCMLDLYGLPRSYPGFTGHESPSTAQERAERVEDALQKDLAHPRDRFIPYIQVYEFEAVLLSELAPLRKAFPEAADAVQTLWAVCLKYACPEDINDSTPPAKLLIKLLKQYRKTNDSARILQHLSLPAIRGKCPHFSEWLCKLEALGDAAS